MRTSLLYIAGKSGGHITPALTLAQYEHASGVRIFFIAQDRPLDRKLLAAHPWITDTLFLTIPTVSRRSWWRYPQYGIQLLFAFLRAYRALKRWKPEYIISMGGLVSLPVCSAARFLNIPYALYELNSELGSAVRYLQDYAAEVRCCSTRALAQLNPYTIGKEVPYPLRTQSPPLASPAHARVALNLDPYRYTIFVIGGSQGSQSLNECVRDWIRTIPPAERSNLQIIHQTGTAQEQLVTESYTSLRVVALVFSYRDDLAHCYQAANCVVTRAGAGALHELAYFGNQALIIPLITADTVHQRTNAHELAERNRHWTVLEQHDTGGIMDWLTKAYQEGLS